MLETPGWCAKLHKGEPGYRWSLSVNCLGYDRPASTFMNLGPAWISILDILCVLFFVYSRWYRRKYTITQEELNAHVGREDGNEGSEKTFLVQEQKFNKKLDLVLLILSACVVAEQIFRIV